MMYTYNHHHDHWRSPWIVDSLLRLRVAQAEGSQQRGIVRNHLFSKNLDLPFPDLRSTWSIWFQGAQNMLLQSSVTSLPLLSSCFRFHKTARLQLSFSTLWKTKSFFDIIWNFVPASSWSILPSLILYLILEDIELSSWYLPFQFLFHLHFWLV